MFTPTYKYAVAHLKKERIRSDAGLIMNKNVSVGKNFFAIGFHNTGVSSLTRRQLANRPLASSECDLEHRQMNFA